jgi:hypothetical protein
VGVTRLARGVGVGLLALITATPAAAQFPLPIPGQTPPPDPQDLQQPRRAPFTITPSLTITEEFNDNIFIDNDDKRWDFITGFTPGLAINFEDATRRLNLAYSFTAEVFARSPEENHAFDRQSFVGDALWRVTPQLTLVVADTFAFTTDTNLIGTEAVATGRDRAWTNTLSGGASWQFDRFTALRTGGAWTVERFDRSESQDSDVYRADVTLDRRLANQLSGTAGYQFAYFNIDRERTTFTHTPRLGVTWDPTDSITLSVNGGPSIEVKEGRSTRVTPAVTAAYRQRLPFGAWGVSYDKAIGTAGGLGGTTDNHLAAAYLDVTTLARGLILSFSPRYSIVESPRDDSIDIKSFTLGLQAIYRLTSTIALVAGYQFFHQRSDSTALTTTGNPLANDADQNRVFFGVQFGFPFRFD